MMEKKIENNPDLIKSGGAIMSIDEEAYLAALKRASRSKELDSLFKRIDKLEKTFISIEQKLDYIINKI